MSRARTIADFGDGIATADIDDGAVTAAKINSTLDLTGKTVTLPAGVGGKVLQVKQSIKVDTTYVQSTSFTDIGLAVAITPSSTTSKILVTVHLWGYPDYFFARGRLMRNSTEIGQPQAAGNRPPHALSIASRPDGDGMVECVSAEVLDSPATTSAITYKVQVASRADNSSQGFFVNRSDVDRNAIHDGRHSSFLTVMEIGV